MEEVVVKGSSGHIVVADLLGNGYNVMVMNQVKPADDSGTTFMQADLTNLGQVLEILVNAVISANLANIPDPFLPRRTFTENMLTDYNVFSADPRLKW